MNILFLFQYVINPSHGGVERVTNLLGGELKARGYDIFYLSLRKTSSSEIDARVDFNNPQLGISNFEENREEYLSEYLNIIKKNNIDVVISQELIPESLFLLNNTPRNILRISCYHMQPFAYIGRESILKQLTYPTTVKGKISRLLTLIWPYPFHVHSLSKERHKFDSMAKVSDKIVLLSERFIPRFTFFYPEFSLEKLTAINNPNTFDKEYEFADSNKEKLVLYVGRLADSQKNVLGFMDMWKIFYESNPGWKAKIIGHGYKRQMYEDYAKKIGVTNLTFEGQRSDVSDFFRKADFICLTSLSEGWGMVLTEGMAYGCIPVCFDTYESARDIIDDNVSGIIAKPLDNINMAERMTEVVANPSMKQSMAKAAKLKVKQFNLSETVDRWEKLLQKMRRSQLR